MTLRTINSAIKTISSATILLALLLPGLCAGSVVGIWAPDFVGGVNVPGCHLHFITEDRKAGGHILEIEVSNATVQVDVTPGFAMQLPSRGDFCNVNLSGDLQEELKRIEK